MKTRSIFAAALLVLFVNIGCTNLTANRDNVYMIVSEADATAADFQAILGQEDKISRKIAKIRAKAQPLIVVLKAWKDDPTSDDPTALLRSVLASIEAEVKTFDDEKKRRRALAILAAVRLALRANGVTGL